MEVKLEGKVALVTGAGRGIGRAIALRLGRSGSAVAVNYHRHQDQAEEVVRELKALGRQAMAFQADVSASSQVNEMVERVFEDFGGHLDILVNNAGIYNYTEVVNLIDSEWRRMLDVDLSGVFYMSRAVARMMIRKGAGGRIVGIASGAGHSGRLGQAHYCAAKAGHILLCKTLALELAPYNINVNSISVGFVDVGQFDDPDTKSIKEDILRRILLRRPGQPEDIANMVAFLASEKAGWITGADFRVDGGEAAGRVPFREHY